MERIVQIGSYPLSGECVHGGIEASVFGISQELSRDYEVHVFDNPRIGGKTEVERQGSIVVHRFGNRGGHQFLAMRQVDMIVQEIVSLAPDVCHIHGTHLFAWLIYRKLRKAKFHVVVTVHGLAVVEKRNALKKRITMKGLLQFLYQGWVEKRFLSQLPMAIVDTEYVRDQVNGYSMSRKPVMYVIPQGINEEFFSLQSTTDSNVILSVGAIGPRKGQLTVLHVFEQVRRAGTNARLVLVGTIADHSYLGRLQEAIAQSAFKDDVDLCIDLNDADLKALYEKAHLFVLYSEEESQGIVFAEAMSVGLPVVATKVGGVSYVVKHGKTGLLSDYGDVKAFADHMTILMNDSDLWNKMSEASRDEAKNYHWADISYQVCQLYKL